MCRRRDRSTRKLSGRSGRACGCGNLRLGYERRLLLTNRAPRPDDVTAAELGDFLLTGLLPRNFLNR
jgi:hypothetical protein